MGYPAYQQDHASRYPLRDVKQEEASTKSPMQKKTSCGGVRYLLSFCVLAFSLSFLHIHSMQQISANQQTVVKIGKEISQLEDKLKGAQAKIEALKSSKKIEEEARLKLGMIYPSENDKIYINSKETETATRKEERPATMGFIQSLISKIR